MRRTFCQFVLRFASVSVAVSGVAMSGWFVPVASATDPVVCSVGATTICNDVIVGEASWTVPTGITKVLFTVFGGSGGKSLRPGGGLGGNGGEASATFNVTPGQVFQLYVGPRGGDGPNVSHNGGGGTLVTGCQAGYGAGPSFDGCGGDGSDVASPISNDPGPRILMSAGGGGGGGGNSRGGDGGGVTGIVAPPAPSGAGTGGTGASAKRGGTGGMSFDGHPPINGTSNGAGGDGYGPVMFDLGVPFGFRFQTQNHGGAAAGGYNTAIFPGDYSAAGGGGGGGYYGGGGGGDCSADSSDPLTPCGTGGGGGGGGSAFVDPSATTVTGFDGGNSAGSDGKIVITFSKSSTPPPKCALTHTCPPRPKAHVGLPSGTAGVSAKGTTSITITCAHNGSRCRGALKLTTKSRVRIGHSHRTRLRTITLARASYSVAAGHKAKVPLRLNATGRRLLTKARGHHLKVRITAGSTHRSITLKLAPARRTRHH